METFFSALLTVALSADASAAPVPVPADIQIASFLFEVSHQSDDVMYCIEVDGADASESVLSEVKKKNANVVRGSECVEEISGSYHKTTHRNAEFVRLSKYRAIDSTHASVGLLAYRNGKWAEGSKLSLKHSAKGWTVTGKKVSFVS